MTRAAFHRALFAAGLVAWIASAAVRWWSAAPLGHDEAQYALAARDLQHGEPARWLYLSPGMDAIAAPGLVAGGSERELRALPLLVGIAFLLISAQLARRLAGDATAAWLVAVLGGTRPMLKISCELLSDLPSATCLLGATIVIAGELKRAEGPRWRLVAAAPLLAAAFYLRYGSCLPIAILGGAALVVGGRAIARKPAPAITTVAVFAVLMIPHAIAALAASGSPFGILLFSASVPGGAGEGLVTYVTSDPFALYGVLTAPLMIIGLIALRRDRVVALCWIVAVADIIAIGLTTRAQARYVLVGTTLLVILGIDLIRRTVIARGAVVQRAVAAVALVAIAITWFEGVQGARRYRAGRLDTVDGTLAAADVLGRDAGGAPCFVSGRHLTQLEWYSGCRGVGDPPPDALARGAPIYAVRDHTGGPNQPVFAEFPGTHQTILAIPDIVDVIRIRP